MYPAAERSIWWSPCMALISSEYQPHRRLSIALLATAFAPGRNPAPVTNRRAAGIYCQGFWNRCVTRCVSTCDNISVDCIGAMTAAWQFLFNGPIDVGIQTGGFSPNSGIFIDPNRTPP